MCTVLIILAGLIVASQAAPHVKLPKGFVQCKQNDPEFDTCVTRATNLAIPEVAKGVHKFGLPPADPLVISQLNIDQGTGPVTIKLNFTDLHIRGMSNAKVKSAKMDVPNGKGWVNLDIDKLILDGTYSVLGKVLVLPISGNGHSQFVLNDFKTMSVLNYKQVEKDGEIYWHVESLDLDFTVSRLQIALENLFNGNKELGDNMNNFLNENWPEILAELKPAFKTAFGTAIMEIIQRFHSRVPLYQIFPKE